MKKLCKKCWHTFKTNWPDDLYCTKCLEILDLPDDMIQEEGDLDDFFVVNLDELIKIYHFTFDDNTNENNTGEQIL